MGPKPLSGSSPGSVLAMVAAFGAPGGAVPGPRLDTLPRMAEPEHDASFVDRLSRTGEEALGRIAEELVANPVVNGAVARAFEAREKADSSRT